MSRQTTTLTEELYAYYRDVAYREGDILSRLREETGKLENARMQISPEQGQFMTTLVGAIGARLTLEIGTFTGYSALCIALGLPDDGRLITLDKNEEWPSFGRRYWAEAGVSDRIEFWPGDAVASLDRLMSLGMDGDFDFVFVDADKKHVDDYYEKSLRLVRAGGLIAVDNTLWGGRVADPEVHDDATMAIRGFNAKAVDDARVVMSLVPIGDGVTLLRKR